jgi:hypothetical protein
MTEKRIKWMTDDKQDISKLNKKGGTAKNNTNEDEGDIIKL